MDKPYKSRIFTHREITGYLCDFYGFYLLDEPAYFAAVVKTNAITQWLPVCTLYGTDLWRVTVGFAGVTLQIHVLSSLRSIHTHSVFWTLPQHKCRWQVEFVPISISACAVSSGCSPYRYNTTKK